MLETVSSHEILVVVNISLMILIPYLAVMSDFPVDQEI